MISRYKLLCVFIALLLASAGCLTIPILGEENQWSLSMSGHDEQIGDGYRFTGEVALGGHYSDVTAKGVRIEFLNGENDTIETRHVGTLNASRTPVGINISVGQRPKYVLVFVGEITAPQSNNDESGVSGLERVENGDYYRFSAYNPHTPPSETNG